MSPPPFSEAKAGQFGMLKLAQYLKSELDKLAL